MATQHSKTHTSGKDTNKSARELEQDVKATRSAISSDIQELGHKLSPSHLKDNALDAMGEMAGAAKDKAVEVKDVVVDKAVEVKDAIVDKAVEVKDLASDQIAVAGEALSETIDEVSAQARRAGTATWKFTSDNALPLTLVGIGAGWLIARNLGGSRGASAESSASKRTGGNLPRTASQRGNRSDGAQSLVSQASAVAQRTEQSIADSATRGVNYLQDGMRKVTDATRSLAEENPLAFALGTLVAGVGIGMLLPVSEGEAKLLAPVRERFESMIGDAREAASDVANLAKEAATASINALT